MHSVWLLQQLLQSDTSDNSQATQLHIKTPFQMYTSSLLRVNKECGQPRLKKVMP